VGENITLLFEFKVSGTLNAAQFAAHRTKLSSDALEVEATWKQVGEAIRSLEADDCCVDPAREKPAWNRWRFGTQ
jgi:hypothetical protein